MARTPRSAWNPENEGYGKHDYRHIDPTTINTEEYATSLRGEEVHKGDIREYNSGYNAAHPDTNLSLDDIARIGSVFETEAESYKGQWVIASYPLVRSPEVFVRAKRFVDGEPSGSVEVISAVDLGLIVDAKNYHKQVKTTLVTRGDTKSAFRNRAEPSH